jgi:hypothetical protein
MSDLDDLLAPRPKPSTLGTLVYILFGLIVWAAQLTLVYLGHTLACRLGWPLQAADVLVLGGSIALAAIVIAFLAAPAPVARRLGLPPGMEDRRVYDRFARAIALLAAVAILWTGATALLVAACTQGR